jgi:uncharacterized protein (DUF58 family)
VVAVEIRDPREQELPDVGELWLVDPETGRQLRVDTRSRRLRERFQAAATAERDELAAELRATGSDHVVLWTAGDWLRTLAGFLRHRATGPGGLLARPAGSADLLPVRHVAGATNPLAPRGHAR